MTPSEADIDLGGVPVHTWAYNGLVPAKEIRLRKGQTLRAVLTNKLPDATTVHWHGLAIPNPMDGVPVLTQPATASGQSFTYDFVPPDSGTYWLHSHEGTQLDRGLYGPLIIEDPNEKGGYDDELVVVLDDWIDGTGTTPDQVLANLKKNGMASMAPADPSADVSPTTPLGDDGGDVKYPYYLINGRITKDPQVVDYRSGQRIRLRVINAASDTAFRVAVPGTALTVTHTDGFPVVPQQADSVILGMGERVDATITVNSSVPVIAAAERKDGYARLNLRVNGAPSSVNVDQFVAGLRNSTVLNTAGLAAAPQVQLTQRNPDQTVEMRLAGPVNGYNWTINGQALQPAEQRRRRAQGAAGADKLHQPVEDVSSDAPAWPYVPSDGRQWARRPQGHRAGATVGDGQHRLRHRQPRPMDRPLPQHLSPGSGDGQLHLLLVGLQRSKCLAAFSPILPRAACG